MTDEEKKAYDNLIMLKYFTMEKEDKQAKEIEQRLNRVCSLDDCDEEFEL